MCCRALCTLCSRHITNIRTHIQAEQANKHKEMRAQIHEYKQDGGTHISYTLYNLTNTYKNFNIILGLRELARKAYESLRPYVCVWEYGIQFTEYLQICRNHRNS